MDLELVEKLKSFSLSSVETGRIQLGEGDVKIGVEEGSRSLLGKVYGDKCANFIGVKSSLLKLWQHRGLCKVIALTHNIFQFVFTKASDRDGIMKGRPWFFDNQLLILHPWTEEVQWDAMSFTTSPIWVQVWHLPLHWLSIETGKKVGNLLGNTLDVLVVDSGSKEGWHIKLLVEIDLETPLVRGTKITYKQSEVWVLFRYE